MFAKPSKTFRTLRYPSLCPNNNKKWKKWQSEFNCISFFFFVAFLYYWRVLLLSTHYSIFLSWFTNSPFTIYSVMYKHEMAFIQSHGENFRQNFSLQKQNRIRNCICFREYNKSMAKTRRQCEDTFFLFFGFNAMRWDTYRCSCNQ